MKLDVLAFGAHPDDVELGAGGSIAKMTAMGMKVGIVDLTEGQLGTRGSIQKRYAEADKAAEILGLSVRENLKMEDGFFENNKENKDRVISCIRKYKPRIVLCNAPYDRHPDHGRGSDLVKEAVFYSGLRMWKTMDQGKDQEAHRPEAVYQYMQFYNLEPDLIMDVSGYEEVKMKAIKAYDSQFYKPGTNEPETAIAQKGFLDSIYHRMVDHGRLIGREAGEGFMVERKPGVNTLLDLI